MWYCNECGEFIEPNTEHYYITHDELDSGRRLEEVTELHCPNCGGMDIERAYPCEICGEYAIPRKRFCEGCHERAEWYVEQLAEDRNISIDDAYALIEEVEDGLY